MDTCANRSPGGRRHLLRLLAVILGLLVPAVLRAQQPRAELPKTPSKAPLRGTVVDERGRPVAGAAVSGVKESIVRGSSSSIARLRSRLGRAGRRALAWSTILGAFLSQ